MTQHPQFIESKIACVRNFFSVMFPYMHGNIWSQARDTGNKQTENGFHRKSEPGGSGNQRIRTIGMRIMAPRTKPSRGGAEESQFVQQGGFGSVR